MDTSTKHLPKHLCPNFESKSNPESTVVLLENKLRFTVLFSRLFRIEFYPEDIPSFEDRASQVFWFRNHPTPKFHSKNENGIFEIDTDFLHLKCLIGAKFGDKDFLTIHLKSCDTVWHYGDKSTGNLGGTCRTLDFTNGNALLDQGLISREGWVLVDDSATLVMNERGMPMPRNCPDGTLDLYFFGYGQDYESCLLEFRGLTGSVPLVPRYIFGNWWSRFWEYSQQDIMDVITDFEKHDIPLSVFIIDMDWHIVNSEKNTTTDGWSGYTWNEKLFPNYKNLLKFIHDKGLRTSLNLHPADGIHYHEQQYPQFCAAVGQDPEKHQPVLFDPSDECFIKAYLEILHHPYENDGVDFWWIDWQQGTKTKMEGLDALWLLNHIHFYDLGRDGQKRPFTFSRWAGLGSHRYPIGFSGDTVVSWDSLSYLPYFTATASNIGYGWWSHDIGGHYNGTEEPELYLRWVQYGVLSPILRLHSGKNYFSERRPFGYDAEILRISKSALQFRHALIPYLYTCAWRDTEFGIPLIRPLYHLYPNEEACYHFPNIYAFGPQLLASPHTSPCDPDTHLSRQVIYLPPGDWYNFFTGIHYSGARCHVIYGDLEDIPLFARAGAIIPLARVEGWGSWGVENPKHMVVRVFPGEEGCFELYEDDGWSTGYKQGKSWITKFEMKNKNGNIQFIVKSGNGGEKNTEFLTQRTFELEFFGINSPQKVHIKSVKHDEIPVTTKYDQKSQILRIILTNVDTVDTLEVTIESTWAVLNRNIVETCLEMLKKFKLTSRTKKTIYKSIHEIVQNPSLLLPFNSSFSPKQAQALFETILNTGIHHTKIDEKESLIIWNSNSSTHFPNSSSPYGCGCGEEKGGVPAGHTLSVDYMWKKG